MALICSKLVNGSNLFFGRCMNDYICGYSLVNQLAEPFKLIKTIHLNCQVKLKISASQQIFMKGGCIHFCIYGALTPTQCKPNLKTTNQTSTRKLLVWKHS